MNYFADCVTAEEKKARFRELARKLHPDVGGTTAEMQELNKQYWESLNQLDYDRFDEDEGLYTEYEVENFDAALIDPKRPLIVVVASFSSWSNRIGLCSMDCRLWGVIETENAEERATWKARSRKDKNTGWDLLGLTPNEYTSYVNRPIFGSKKTPKNSPEKVRRMKSK